MDNEVSETVLPCGCKRSTKVIDGAGVSITVLCKDHDGDWVDAGEAATPEQAEYLNKIAKDLS